MSDGSRSIVNCAAETEFDRAGHGSRPARFCPFPARLAAVDGRQSTSASERSLDHDVLADDDAADGVPNGLDQRIERCTACEPSLGSRRSAPRPAASCLFPSVVPSTRRDSCSANADDRECLHPAARAGYLPLTADCRGWRGKVNLFPGIIRRPIDSFVAGQCIAETPDNLFPATQTVAVRTPGWWYSCLSYRSPHAPRGILHAERKGYNENVPRPTPARA